LASASTSVRLAAGSGQIALGIDVPPRRASLGSNALQRLARNRLALLGAGLVVLFLAIALLAPVIARYPFDAQVFPRNSAANAQNWLGTDDLGRDMFSRLVYGARISLLVGVATQVLVVALGVLLGCVSGFFGRWVDVLLMRVTDVMYAFPATLFAIVLIAVMGRKVSNIVIAIGISMLPNMIRLVRSAVLTVRELEFIEAARAIGASNGRIMALHVLPNVLSPIIVAATFGIPAAIMSEASLSFIGLGVTPPTPSWGLMVNDGFRWIRSAPMLALVPSISISVTLFAFNFLGDGLRDALDPKSTNYA
jgi:peptide/nickel transport system permease protein